MRILSGVAAVARVRKLAARGSRYAEVEPVVRRIIADVRRQGDPLCASMPNDGMALHSREPFQVSEQEIQAAWKSTSPELKASLRTAAANIRRFCERQKPVEWTSHTQGDHRGTNRPAPRFGGLLRSRWTLPAGLDIADDGYPRPGGGG